MSLSSKTGTDSKIGSNIYVDNEVDVIYDEDLIDASDSVSLESGIDDDAKVRGISDYLNNIERSVNPSHLPRGYIDEEIVQDVISSPKRVILFRSKKKITLSAIIAVTAILAIVSGVSLNIEGSKSLEERVDENIRGKSTAFDFNDHDKFAEQKNSEGQSNQENPLGDAVRIPFGIGNNFMDFEESSFDAEHETPFFWQIPKSGDIFQSIMTACLRKVLATDIHWKNEDIIKINMVNSHPYVNVDLSMPEGIQHAADQGLVASGLADVVSSPHLQFSASKLFDREHKGRMFTVFRHPVDRTIATYHLVLKETNDPVVSNMTLTEFVSSPYMDKDWFTRFLVNKRQVQLNLGDLQLAKEIIRRKCVVGIHEDIETSMKHFETYFSWETNGKAFDMCTSAIIENERMRAKDTYARIGMIKEGDPVYETIVHLNLFDMQLYWYAYDLFEEQKKWLKR